MPVWLLLLILWLLIRDDDRPGPEHPRAPWGTYGIPGPWPPTMKPGYWTVNGSLNGGQEGQGPANPQGAVGVDITVGAADGVARF